MTDLERLAIQRYKEQMNTENVVTAYKDKQWPVVHVTETVPGDPTEETTIVGAAVYSIEVLRGQKGANSE